MPASSSQPAARADVDAIFGIPPTVAIEQRTSRGGHKSTVGTLTEIHHYLRLLYVKLGTQHCPDCDLPIEPQTRDAIVARLLREHRGEHIGLLAPLVVNRKGYLHRPRQVGAGQGLHPSAGGRRIPADGQLAAAGPLPRAQHRTAGGGYRRLPREEDALRDALRRALDHGKGVVQVIWPLDTLVRAIDNGDGTPVLQQAVFSTQRACPSCGKSFAEPDPRCSPSTPSMGGAKAASAPALPCPASTRSRAARRSGGTNGGRARSMSAPPATAGG